MAKNSEATLLLKIKEVGSEALSKIKEGFEAISAQAAVASAALIAFLGMSVKNYGEAEEASNKLSKAINNQGLDVEALKKKYDDLAGAISAKSKYDDDEITAALASAQAMAGQIELTEDLIRATVDYAAATGTDLNSAFEKVGKSIGTATNALAREGIQIDENASSSVKMDKITKALTARYKDQAEVLASGVNGSMAKFANAVGNLTEQIGKHLAPLVQTATGYLTDLVRIVQENEDLVKWGTIIAAVGAGVLGLVGAIGGVLAILPTLAAGVGVVSAAFAALAGPGGILLVAAAALGGLALAWSQNFGEIQEIAYGTISVIQKMFEAFAADVTRIFGGIGDVIGGALSLDVERIKNGMSQITAASKQSAEALYKAYYDGFEGRKKHLQDIVDHQKSAETKAAAHTVKTQLKANESKKKDAVATHESTIGELRQMDEAAMAEELARQEELAQQKAAAEIAAAEYADFKHREMLGTLGDYASTFITSGFEGIAQASVSALTESLLPGFGTAAGQMFGLLAQDSDKFLETVNQLFSTKFLDNIATNLPILIQKFAEGLPGLIDKISEKMPEIVSSLIAAIISNAPAIAVAMAKMFSSPKFAEALVLAVANGFANGVRDGLKDLGKIISDAVKKAMSDVSGGLSGGGGGGGGDGGLVGKAKKALGFSRGGVVPGLPIQKFAAGGTVDTVPAMLSPGEFVMNAEATRKNFNALNSMNNGGNFGSGGTVIHLNVNGGLLGDTQEAYRFAKVIDSELNKLRQKNASTAFDKPTF